MEKIKKNEELRDLYASLLAWLNVEMRKAYKILVKKSEENILLMKARHS
jgi:hypothetical protein